MDAETTGSLNATLTLLATPVVTILQPGNRAVPVAEQQRPNGFQCDVEATLPYTALNEILNPVLQGKRIELSEGFIKQHLVVEQCKLYSAGNLLATEISFSGSHTGTLLLSGLPFYNPQTAKIEVQNLAYAVKTKSFLLQGAKWLFNNIILEELKKHTAIDIKPFYRTVSGRINELLNKQWKTGIEVSGTVAEISITHVAVQSQGLRLRSQCRGSLQIVVAASALKFQM